MGGILMKEKRLYTVLTVVLFVTGAFAFWQFFYNLANMVGAIVCASPDMALYELKRMLPLFLSAFLLVALGIMVHHAYIAPSVEKRIAIWRNISLTSGITGVVITGIVVNGRLTGIYVRAVEGGATLLFPLDIAIGGVVFFLLGVLSVRYVAYLKEAGSSLPCIRTHCAAVWRVTGRFFCMIGYIIALCSLAACIYGLRIMDWSHGGIFFNVMLWIEYFTVVLQAVVYRFVFTDKEEALRAGTMKRLGGSFLAVNIVMLVLYLVSLQIYNEAPNLNANGILPIEFTWNVNGFMVFIGLNNILAPAIALVKGSLMERKKV